MIERFDTGPRMSEMTVHHGVAYLAGQVPEDTSADIVGQTEQVLKAIDDLLRLAPTDKSHILRAEMPGPIVGKLVPRAKQTARILYLIYVFLTAAEVILLVCGKMPLFFFATLIYQVTLS